MLYKTIALRLLEQNEALYEKLRRQKRVLAAMNNLAIELKELHLRWIEQLTLKYPAKDKKLVTSQALELATQQIQATSLPV